MKQRNLIFLFCAVLLVAGCTEKKQNHMKSPDFEVLSLPNMCVILRLPAR